VKVCRQSRGKKMEDVREVFLKAVKERLVYTKDKYLKSIRIYQNEGFMLFHDKDDEFNCNSDNLLKSQIAVFEGIISKDSQKVINCLKNIKKINNDLMDIVIKDSNSKDLILSLTDDKVVFKEGVFNEQFTIDHGKYAMEINDLFFATLPVCIRESDYFGNDFDYSLFFNI
jgi:hypothetical protein